MTFTDFDDPRVQAALVVLAKFIQLVSLRFIMLDDSDCIKFYYRIQFNNNLGQGSSKEEIWYQCSYPDYTIKVCPRPFKFLD